jgi:phosphatidate cytidylyltransferase
MFERAGIRPYRLVGLAGGIVVTASVALPVSDRMSFTAALLAVFIAALGRREGAPVNWEPVAITVLGICYVNWLLVYGFWLRELPSGREWVLLLIWVTWLGETAAYLVGSTVGRWPLAPVISPKKTVEGAVAQFAVSIAAAVIGQAWFFTALSREDAVIVGALLGVIGQVGDLFESVLKRSVGAKDAGRLMPGHGGMLDRIDSLLFNTPVLFYYASHGRILTS